MNKHIIALALLAIGAGANAQSWTEGKPVSAWTFKFGAVHVDPKSTASDLQGPVPFPAPGGVPAGASLHVDPKATLYFSIQRDITENWSVEFAGGTPPTHNVRAVIGNNPMLDPVRAIDGQVIARVRQVAPTFFVNHTWGQAGDEFRPFMGLGMNYTKFDKADSTAYGNAMSGGPTKLSLKDSKGVAFQVGLNYRLNDRFGLGVSYTTARVKTELDATTAGYVRKSNIVFHPQVFGATLQYHY